MPFETLHRFKLWIVQSDICTMPLGKALPRPRSRDRSPTRVTPRALGRALLALAVAAVLLGVPATANALAPYWGQLGASPSTLDGGAATSIDMELSGTTPYVSYIVSNSIVVRRWDGASWVAVGTPLQLVPGANTATARMAMDTAGFPVVAWREAGSDGLYDVYVKRWNGASWSQLGGAINIDQGYDTGTLDITVDSVNRPIVAWNEASTGSGNKVMFAKRWNSGTTTWDLLGGGTMNMSNNRNTDQVRITTIGTTLHAVWMEEQNGSTLKDIVAASTTGATWAAHNGGATFLVDDTKNGSAPAIANDGTDVYIGWTETTATTGVKATYVERGNGAVFTPLGGAIGTAAGIDTNGVSITAAGGTVRIAWDEGYATAGRRVFAATWSGAVWNLIGPTGIDADWLRTDSSAQVGFDGTNTVVGWLEFGNKATVYRWGDDVQSGAGTLVPVSDRVGGGFIRTTKVSSTCSGSGAGTLYQGIDEDVDAATSGVCYAGWWGSSPGADFIHIVDPSNATAEFELSNARPVLFAHRLRVRVAAWKLGDKTSSATVEVRKSDGTLLGTPVALALSGTQKTGQYDITGLSLSTAELDGLYARLIVNTSGAGTSTTVRVTTVNVDVSYVIQDCGAPPCPPVRPDNLLPDGGTTLAQPTLEADMFADTDGHTHTASQWQLRTESGSYAAPVEDTGTTTTDLITHQVGVALSPNTAYWWRVRYRDSTSTWSSWSRETRFAYDTTPPRPPENRRPLTRSTLAVTLTWDTAADNLALPEGILYDVEAAADGVTWGALCDDVSGLDRTCNLTPNVAATPVYFRVRAQDEAGNVSPWAYYADATYAVRRFSETTASGYMSGAKQANSAAAVAFAATETPSLVGLTGFFQFRPNAVATAAASMPAGISPTTAGQGWFLDELAGTPTTGWCVNDGDLSVTTSNDQSKNNGVVRARGRLFRTTASGGVATGTPTLLGDRNGANVTGTTAAVTSTFNYPPFATPTAFAPDESLYFELWLEILTSVTSSGGAQVVTMASGSFTMPEPGACAATPTGMSGGGSSYAPPVLNATYQHSSSTPGHVVFLIYDDNAGSPGNLVQVGYSQFERAPGAATTYTPYGLPPSSTYHWQTVSEDQQGRRSGLTAAGTFTIIGGASGANVTPATPTLVSPANAASVSTTPTLTALFSDPDADVGSLEFQVCIDVACADAADPLTGGTTYGITNATNGSWIVSPALTAGTTYYWRARASDGVLTSPWSTTQSFVATAIVNNPPTIPVLVSPVDGGGMSTLTPTLTATFDDPDVGDTGTVQFQVCANATCTAGGDPQRSGSSASGIADGANGSWVVSAALTAGTWYWRARNVDASAAASAWSAPRSMVVGGATISLSVDAATKALGLLTPGTDALASSTVTVTTNSITGYTLNATDEHDTWGADGSGTIPDWTGTGATPTTWASGGAGYVGITVRDAPGGRLAKWGTGTGTAENDFVNNKFAGLDLGASSVLHQRATYTSAAEAIIVTYRYNVPASQTSGSYDGTVTYTATANP